MSFNLSIGATAPQFSSHLASFNDDNPCGTVPHKFFPAPQPAPILGGIGGNLGDALHKLPGIGGSLGDALHNLPPIGGNVADVLRDVLGGGRMHI